MSRLPPHSKEAETQFLSAALLDGPQVMTEAINATLSAKCFYFPRNQMIYSRLLSMLGDGKALDFAVLMEELKSAGQLESAGGISYLLEISSGQPTTAKAAYFAQKICELYTLRETIREASSLIEKCYEGCENVQEVLSPYAERLMGLAAGSAIEREPSFEELVEEAEKVRATIIKDGGRPKGAIIPFPFFQMDSALEPMQRGQLVVVGARPSIGKSSLTRQLACHTAMQGHNVYFVTLEVNPVQVVLQMGATLARVGVKDLAKVGEDQQVAFRNALIGMKKLGIHLSRKDRSLAQILAKAKAIHSRNPLAMICVDYGGLIDDIATAPSKDKITAIGRVTKAFKKLAVELNCVVVLPWQLNRQMANEGNREPRLTDLRDSGDVEQDADKVLFIHRPSEDPLAKKQQSETTPRWELPLFYQDIIQAKGRDDGTARVGMYFERSLASFTPPNAAPPAQDNLEF